MQQYLPKAICVNLLTVIPGNFSLMSLYNSLDFAKFLEKSFPIPLITIKSRRSRYNFLSLGTLVGACSGQYGKGRRTTQVNFTCMYWYVQTLFVSGEEPGNETITHIL